MLSKKIFFRLGQPVFISAFLIVVLGLPSTSAARSAALDEVIKGAKKEGLLKVLWTEGHAGGDIGLQAFLTAINNRYGTDLSLQFTQGGSFPANLGRLTQEYRAKQPSSTDIFLGSSNHIASGLKSGFLQKVDWEGLVERPAPPDAALPRVAPEGVAMAFASRVVGIVYNTNLVKGDDIPDSLEDVLNPKFKGQIATTPYVTGWYQFSAPDVLGIEFMRNYAQRLAPHLGGMIGCNSLDPVASGQFAMLIFDCGRDATIRYQRRGAPLGHGVPKEIVRDNVIYLGVPANAQNPYAAKLLISFLHTKEGQDLLWEHGAYDLEIYPGSNSYVLIQQFRKKYPTAKYLISSAQRTLKQREQGIDTRVYQKEIRNIFRGAGK